MSKEKKQAQQKKTRKQKSPNLRNKAFKFRIYPTGKQIGELEWTLRRCKELYNTALEEGREAYRMNVALNILTRYQKSKGTGSVPQLSHTLGSWRSPRLESWGASRKQPSAERG